jgi:hypothetical protein
VVKVLPNWGLGSRVAKSHWNPETFLFCLSCQLSVLFANHQLQIGSIQSHIAVSIIEDLAWEDNMLKRRSNLFGTQSEILLRSQRNPKP